MFNPYRNGILRCL